MKPEPLKNKIRTYICPLTSEEGWKFFEDREVKSAVEWLKGKFVHLPNCRTKLFRGGDCDCDYKNVIEVTNEAFEDVMQKE